MLILRSVCFLEFSIFWISLDSDGCLSRTFCFMRLTTESLSLLTYSTSINHGAHPLAMDATSGNARSSDANALDPPSRSRASPLAEEKRGASGTPLPRESNRQLPSSNLLEISFIIIKHLKKFYFCEVS